MNLEGRKEKKKQKVSGKKGIIRAMNDERNQVVEVKLMLNEKKWLSRKKKNKKVKSSKEEEEKNGNKLRKKYKQKQQVNILSLFPFMTTINLSCCCCCWLLLLLLIGCSMLSVIRVSEQTTISASSSSSSSGQQDLSYLNSDSQSSLSAYQNSGGGGGGSSSKCSQMRFVGRDAWQAKRALNESQLRVFPTTPTRVFVHQAWDGRTCLDVDSCTIRVQAMQAYHQHTKGWPDISYNFLISGDGTIYEGIGFNYAGFHTLNYNEQSLGIALIGTFHHTWPSRRMELALNELLECAMELAYLDQEYTLHGHRDARCTICPGDAAYARISRMPRFQSGPLQMYTCPQQQQQQQQQRASNRQLEQFLLAEQQANNAPENITELATAQRTSDDLQSKLDKEQSNNNNYELQNKVVNINSNNNLFAFGLDTPMSSALGAAGGTYETQKVAQAASQTPSPALLVAPATERTSSELVEESFVGLVRRTHSVSSSRQQQDTPSRRVKHSPSSSSMVFEEPEKMAISKSLDKPMVMVNVPQIMSQQQLSSGSMPQPLFYMLAPKGSAPFAVVTAGGGGGSAPTTARPPAPQSTTTTTTARPASPPATTARPPAIATGGPQTTRPPQTTGGGGGVGSSTPTTQRPPAANPAGAGQQPAAAPTTARPPQAAPVTTPRPPTPSGGVASPGQNPPSGQTTTVRPQPGVGGALGLASGWTSSASPIQQQSGNSGGGGSSWFERILAMAFTGNVTLF